MDYTTFNKKIKDFITIAVRRDGGLFSCTGASEDANGMITTIDGTVNDKDGKTIPMSWNAIGRSLSQNSGYDLVKKVKISDI